MSTVFRSVCAAGLSVSMILSIQAGEVIDLENGFPPLGGPIDDISLGRWHAQTFKPNLPFLTAVEFGGFGTNVTAFTSMADGSTITVEFFGTVGGVVTGAPLASVSRQTPLNDGFEQFMGRFLLPEPLDVSSFTNASSIGMVWSTTDPGSWGIESTGDDTDIYTEGAQWESTSQGVVWNLHGNRDLVFRTWGVSNLTDVLSIADVSVGDAVAQEFQSESNVTYLLEFNTNQVQATWESTGFSIVGDGNLMQMYDATGFDINKEYRARALD